MKSISFLTEATTCQGVITRIAISLAKAISLAIVLACSFGTPKLAHAQDCTPNASQVAVFERIDYGGRCAIKGIGEYLPLRNLGFEFFGFNSIKVGANVEALGCTSASMHPCLFAYHDTATLEGTRARKDALYLIVRGRDQRPDCRPSDDQAALWEWEYWFGRCMLVDLGDYPEDPWVRPPFEPHALKVGSNVRATLCSGNDFEDYCLTLLPGYYNHWDYAGTGNTSLGNIVKSVSVQPKNHRSTCVPSANQVAVFEYGNFFGPCRVFGSGAYSLNETLNWARGLEDWDHLIRSLKVGDNVQATLCWTSGTNGRRGLRICGPPMRVDQRRGLRALQPPQDVGLTVQQRGATPPSGGGRSGRGEGNPPPAVGSHDFTVWLGANVPRTGFPWWTGRYPTAGTLNGNLTRVANPFNSVWLGFLKPGYGSVDCGNSDAYVLLLPGQTMTADQMQTAFGSSSPSLPVEFKACSGDVADSHGFHGLPLNITYTTRR